VLLFDSRFIEVRHVETGRLLQILPGNDVRCIWDGRGAKIGSSMNEGQWAADGLDQEARVHAVMNALPEGRGRAAAQVQHVFELIPTVPLYVSAEFKN
jgi:hypothetical protein